MCSSLVKHLALVFTRVLDFLDGTKFGVIKQSMRLAGMIPAATKGFTGVVGEGDGVAEGVTEGVTIGVTARDTEVVAEGETGDKTVAEDEPADIVSVGGGQV